LWDGGIRFGVKVSRNELHTHVHLDMAIIEFLSCIKNKNKNYFNPFKGELIDIPKK